MTKPYYEDEYVTLYHGDCLEVTEWLGADVLVTDPPYGIAWESNKLVPEHTRHAGIQGDQSTEVRDKALGLWGERTAFVFGSLLLPPPTGTRQTAIYGKPLNAGTMSTFSGIRRNVEAIYLIGKHKRGGTSRSAIFQTGATTVSNSHVGLVQRYGHPHAKPVDVLEDLISLTPPGASIADPFAGSGSTLIAARNLGRKAIGIELEERYCEAIVRRFSQQAFDFTALEPRSPELRSSGWPQHDSEDGLFREWAP